MKFQHMGVGYWGSAERMTREGGVADRRMEAEGTEGSSEGESLHNMSTRVICFTTQLFTTSM